MSSFKQPGLTVFLTLSYVNYVLLGIYICLYTLTALVAFDMFVFFVYLLGFPGFLYSFVVTMFGVVQTVQHGSYIKKPLMLLIGNVICLLLIGFNCFVPEWYPHLNFTLNYSKRMEVVHLYQEGKLQAVPEQSDTFNLPLDDQYLAGNGRIYFEDDGIVFYLFIGVTDNYSAYVYSPGHETLNEHWQIPCSIEKLDASWYYVVCS